MILNTSGTTGASKQIYQPEHKLKIANAIARDAQRITKDSKVYTVCKIQHAGGALAQTLPAQEIGATVDVVDFNAYRFMSDIKKYTHTHLTPGHARAIMGTKAFSNADFSGLWVTCGSDIVDWKTITAFVERGATFMTNWGMTELGPVAVNTTFDNIEKVKEYSSLHSAPLLGDVKYCNTRIIDGELHVRGDICVYDDWFATGDLVEEVEGKIYYLGRK